ncbi:ABC transporter ATP-binding protein/permease [Uliginosibacterium sp. H3]|uniref:ABC transporter ATP-binding protein/permease n=1 Tax=Uliginosibacterium silvisoli TaxID=3114758 RepID=A0ABU6K0N0_9RHOO|nr:ABC transporter ATP-binding protein/permease [Uliginosibacterium sp. H3]
MDWSHELLASFIWLSKAFGISIIGLIFVTWGLCRFTGWGRQFKRLAWPYFAPSRSWKPLAVLALIVFMTLFSVRMNVLFSFWYNGFYTAMQKLDAKAFWFMLGVFAILATVHVARALLTYYLRQAFLIHWRTALTDSVIKRWLDNQGYHRSRYVKDAVDNPDQRIQQDVDSFVASSLTLSMGLLDAVVSLFSFTLILWGLSGALTLLGVEIPRAMVFLVYLYVIVATVFAIWIGRPLIQLNFLNEKLNANFRYALIRVREYGESIAFFRGEAVERATLMGRFAGVIGNMWAIVHRSVKFQGFNLSISQAAVVFPMIVQAPRLFSKQITLGDVMQTAEAFGQVQDALSFFRSSYDEFTGYRAVLNRLSGFLDSMDEAERLPVIETQGEAGLLAFESLTVLRPDGGVLLEDLSLRLSAGGALLIRGPSGAGKTTLLRAVAGLWPFATGKVIRPVGEQALFLPQKPYLPLGTLRAALNYPATEHAGAAAEDILRQCQLGHLVSRLDEEADWTGMLSLGEQQRLAIGRALLARPQVLFLDEASSAMDEGLEHAMYGLLRRTLPEAILVSVGHRSSLLEFHTQEMELLGAGKWQTRVLSPA